MFRPPIEPYTKFTNPTKTKHSRTFLEGFLGCLKAWKQHLSIVQVGAHDGVSFDPLSDFIRANEACISVGYVEPQPDVFELLKKNIDFARDARFLNAIISEDGIPTPLYRIRREYWPYYKSSSHLPIHAWPTAIASSDLEHVRKRAHRHISRRANISSPMDAIEILEVPSMSLSEAIDALGYGKVDFVQIDAEGFDDKVIYSLDFDRFRPVGIGFEYAHINGSNYEALLGFLTDKDYSVVRWSPTDEIAIDASISRSNFG